MGGEENTLEKIILVSDSDTSEFENSMSDTFNCFKQNPAELIISNEEPKTILYISGKKFDLDEDIKNLLEKLPDSNFVIVSKMTNGNLYLPSVEFLENPRLVFLDHKYIKSKKGQHDIKNTIRKVIDSKNSPELRKTIRNVQIYNNKLYVLLAPSGAGKTTTRDILLEDMDNISPIMETKTRKRRASEKEPEKYFVKPKEFEELEKNNEFFYTYDRNNNRFGISEDFLEEFNQGKDLIYSSLRWDTIKKLKDKIDEAGFDIDIVPIFLTANENELALRYTDRDLFKKTPKEVKDRFEGIPQEYEELMNEFNKIVDDSVIYPYFIENITGKQDRTVAILKNIINFVRTRNSGETFADSVFMDLFSNNFENREYVNEIICDDAIKNYVVNSYVNVLKISEDQKNNLLDIVNGLSHLKVEKIEYNRNDSRIYIEKPSLNKEEADNLIKMGITPKKLIFKLLQTKTKYVPSVHNIKQNNVNQYNSLEFDIDNENSRSKDLIGWTISDVAPTKNCDSIKYIGISYLETKSGMTEFFQKSD